MEVININDEQVRYRGQRLRGIKVRYSLEFYNPVDKEWHKIGDYPSITVISELLELTYQIVRDLYLGVQPTLKKVYKIEKIK